MNGAGLIDELIRQGSTFAVFREPGQEAVVFVQRTAELQPPLPCQRGFVLSPFDTTDGPSRCIRPDLIMTLDGDDLLWSLGPPLAARSRHADPGLDREGYHRAVEHAVAAIQAGRLQKVVLARTIAADLQGITPGALFQAAADALPNAFVALARTDRYGLWLGASPERLLSVRDQQVEVDALAGTMAADQAPHDAAAWGEKEREEQAVVTRRILGTLHEAGVADARAVGPSVKRAGPVAHLHTRISGRIGEVPALSLAMALHPTPAVGGSPTNEAIALIRQLEPRGRSLYAGYWGPVDAGRADLYVNIRCMELFPDSALLHVGAGITAGSDPQRECDEVERKARTWLDLLDAQRQRG